MLRILQSLKAALITGLIIILPGWLALLLLVKLLAKLSVLVQPIAGRLPEAINHPLLAAVIVFVLTCIAVGFIVKTNAGQFCGKFLGDTIFSRIPGYEPLRNIARQFSDDGINSGFKPSLIDIEDGSLAPAFLIENHVNGHSTVFIPSAPTPMVGSILIMASSRVHPLDVSVPTMMKCISKWGSGSSELLAALDRTKLAPNVTL